MAGRARGGPPGELSHEDFDAQMRINVGGMFNCVTAALPHLKEADGACIVNTSSVSGLGGDWQMFGYYIQHNIGLGFQCFAGGIFVGFALLLYFLPAMMTAIGGDNPWAAGAAVAAVLVLPFLGLWLRGRARRKLR